MSGVPHGVAARGFRSGRGKCCHRPSCACCVNTAKPRIPSRRRSRAAQMGSRRIAGGSIFAVLLRRTRQTIRRIPSVSSRRIRCVGRYWRWALARLLRSRLWHKCHLQVSSIGMRSPRRPHRVRPRLSSPSRLRRRGVAPRTPARRFNRPKPISTRPRDSSRTHARCCGTTRRFAAKRSAATCRNRAPTARPIVSGR